jgi:hypothetical protein
MRNPQIKGTPLQKLKLVQKECQNWLDTYREARNSPEGQGVQLELANALFEEARTVSKDLNAPPVRAQVRQAEKILTALADTEGDYSATAARLRVQLQLQRMGENRPVAQLRDFDECNLKVQYEMVKLQQLERSSRPEPKEARSLEKARKEHLENIIGACKRGLELADKKTPQAALNELHFFLTAGYLAAGDFAHAAQEGEALARLKTPSKRSPTAAAYVLEAHAALLEKDASDANRDGLRNFAGFIINDKGKAWQNEPVLPMARYQLAMLAIRDGKSKDAVEQLENLPPDFPGYVFSQCQLAYMALKVAGDPNVAPSDTDREKWKAKALQALQRIAKLPDKADAATAQMFFAAQLEQGKLLFEAGQAQARKGDLKAAAGKYGEMVQFMQQLQQQFDKGGAVIAAGPKAKLRYALGALKKYGMLGNADLEYRAGNYDKVLSKDLAGGVVAQVQELGKGGAKIALQDYKVTGDILGLALRAQVQKGDLAAAKQTLDLIQRLTSTGDEIPDQGAILRSLIGDLQLQVKDLRAKGDKAQLEKTINTFSAFIDELAKQGGGKMSRNQLIFLANSYNSLGKYDRAAALYAKITAPPAPPAAPPKVEAGQEDDPKAQAARAEYDKAVQDWQAYWLMQVEHGKALRLSKQFAEARKVLARVLATKDAVGKTLAEREEIELLEDEGLWGSALMRWGPFMKQLRPQAARDNKAKEIYFDAYYHWVDCIFEYSQGPKVKGTPKEASYVSQAADYILRLENARNQEGWRFTEVRFRELLRSQPALNVAYEKLKKGQPTSP